MQTKTSDFGLHWFRRDLRIAGNPALARSWKTRQGRVVGLFVVDPAILSRDDFSWRRFGFLMETLNELRRELRAKGSDLIVLEGGPQAAFKKLFNQLGANRSALVSLSFNRDYEPFARTRDAQITEWFETQGVREVWVERDHLLLEPWEVTKADESPFQVYTPFKKKWLTHFGSNEVQERIAFQAKALTKAQSTETEKVFSLTWSELLNKTTLAELDQFEPTLGQARSRQDVKLPEAGSKAALARLTCFGTTAIQSYDTDRDLPDRDGTSMMSLYLKNGSITTAQIIAALKLKGTPEHSPKYLDELIWREFLYSILYHFPKVEHGAFQERFANLAWENDERLFEAWCKGETGYPIVDAGMRQLNETGWMHNRVRMIVASFLTKDLLIDWKWGERYFMSKLLDGDLAPNNGGWQWAASTGCDPQPYFRIFNPWLQLERFDPEGTYVKTYVKELRDQVVPAKPPVSPLDASWPKGYPRPIVEHAAQKERALALFKNVKP